MFLRPILLGATMLAVLSACGHNSGPRQMNSTAVKTSFELLVGDQEKTSVIVKAKERFMEREVRPTSAAVLMADYTYQSAERTKHIPKGTVLFGAYGAASRIESLIQARPYDAPTAPPLTLGERPTTKRPSMPSDPLLAKLKSRDDKQKTSGFAVYCGLMSAKYDGGDMWGALFTLGLNLAAKNKDVFCLQDRDLDGAFDRVWDSTLDYAFPPTVNTIYNDRTTTPVAYETLEPTQIEAIGTLWLQLSSKGFRKGALEVNSRLGRDGKFVEFDNQRIKINIDESGKTEIQNFFGASYVIENTQSREHKRVHVTPAKTNSSISLSKQVHYTNRTTYIPIFVPQ